MKRIRELDGLRGIAILLVVGFHYFTCQVLPDDPLPFRFLGRAFFQGWNGVDLFFVLSGFLIVGILLDARGSRNFFRVFYTRRACRILPLYYLIVILFVLLGVTGLVKNDWLFTGGLPLWSYLTLTQNYLMHAQGFGPNWLGVTWSLAIEEQFYLVIPLLVWLLNRKQLFAVLLIGGANAVGLREPAVRRWLEDRLLFLQLAASLLVVLLLAELSFRYFESRFLALGKRVAFSGTAAQ